MEAAGVELEARLRDLVGRELGAALRRVEWLPGALGLRRFARLHLAGAAAPTAIARIEAPEDPAGRPAGAAPEPPLEPIRALLAREGLPVPARLAADAAAGIEVLEDVGSVTLADAAGAATADERARLYEEACDLVPRLQRVRDPGGVAAFARRLDAALYAYKAALFADEVIAPAAGAAAAGAARAALRHAGERLRDAPLRLAHRDLQSANVHVRADRPPGRRLALIDLQGAFLAPPEYDLVCLLRDSYVELPQPEVWRLLERVRGALPDAPAAEACAARFDWLTLTRKGKDLARFVHAARARGDRRYLRFAPATLRHLRAAAAAASARDAAFAPLCEILAGLPEDACAR